MAKVIIGIHGLGNKPDKETLEKWWKAAINEGLKRTGKPFPPFRFELVYWADILYDKPLDPSCTDGESPYFLAERYVPSTGESPHENQNFRKKVLDFLSDELDSLFLNEDFSLNYSGLTDRILQRWFRDLEVYYNGQAVAGMPLPRDVIRRRLVDVLKKYRKHEVLLIGHSMGSIVAYDVMSFVAPEAKIDTFITIGSPLGIPVVKSKIAAEQQIMGGKMLRLSAPESIGRNWYNFADLRDKVAFHYRLSDDFGNNRQGVKPVDIGVINDYVTDREPNPHKSYGYLRATEVSEAIREFLVYRKPGLFRRWLNRLWGKKQYLM